MKKKSFELKKKFLLIMFGVFLLAAPVFAAQSFDSLFDSGVEEYRKGNVSECLEIMKMLVRKDPTNSYVVYYLAMANAKSGNIDEAKENYENVIMLNQDSQLVSYAKEGIKNIEIATGQPANASKKEKKSFKLMDKPPEKTEESKDVAKANVSDDEIAKAIKTLKDAGLLNVQVGVGAAAVNPLAQNSELMNLNMMMGAMGGGKNSGMDMLPMLMMQQQQTQNGGKSNISPEMIQMMMNNAMLDGMSAFDTNDKDK